MNVSNWAKQEIFPAHAVVSAEPIPSMGEIYVGNPPMCTSTPDTVPLDLAMLRVVAERYTVGRGCVAAV